MSLLRDTWYVAAWSRELPAGKLLASTLLGEPLVLWRTADGANTALEDRCVHRHAPLSLGRLEGDALRCGHHGLKFAPSGQCIEVPALALVPDSGQGQRAVCVRRYAVVEHRHWVMVWMGDAAMANPSLLLDNFSCDSAEWACCPGYVHYQTPSEPIADNLLDFSHLSYVHAATFGGGDDDTLARILPQVQRLLHGVRVRRDVPHVPPPAHYQPLWAYQRPVDRWLPYDFILPGVLLMHSGAQPAGMSAEDAKAHDVGVRFHSCQALTREAATSTYYFFMEAHPAYRGDASVTDALHQGIVRAFDEDHAMISAQWQNIQRYLQRPMLPLAMDKALLHYRAVFAQALAAHAPSFEPVLQARVTTPAIGVNQAPPTAPKPHDRKHCPSIRPETAASLPRVPAA